MRCIYCGEKTRTVNSRGTSKGYETWRRRQCTGCETVFTSIERADLASALRVKARTGPLQPFVSEKLYLDVYDSLSHRKTAQTDAKQLTATIILKLLPCKSGVLDSSEINHAAMEVLRRFDKIAATHYKARHF